MAERLAPQVRRERILDVAMDICDAEGHSGLTMAELARRCDMSAPGLMHYFPTIDHLLVAVVQRRDERDWADLELETFAADVRGGLDALVENIASRPRAALLFAMVEADALDPAHPGHAYFRERAAEFARDLASVLPGADAVARAERIGAVLDGLQLHFLRDPEHFDLRGHWRVAADALL